MAWWGSKRQRGSDVDSPVPSVAPDQALVAAAQVVQSLKAGQTRITPRYDTWQLELWNYYDSLGEFNIAVTWRAHMTSRVRLRAARLKADTDEPEIMDVGPAAELVNELFGGTSGQSEAMSTLSVFMDVPGEGWLAGESVGNGHKWRVLSSEEIRRGGRIRSARSDGSDQGYEIISEYSTESNVIWVPLGADSFVTRIWGPHKRLRYLPYSSAYSARSAMRELELVNRHIQAQYLSRVSSAGVILFPDDMTFPARDEFLDAPDPFIREWVETAAEAIKTPGAASAVIPMPMRVPSEYIDKIKHIDFTLQIDDKIIEKRDSARNRLASQINVPADLLFNAGAVNHWGLWQMEEGAIRTYITPHVEIITNALTIGYLRPMLKARGVEDADRWIIWYDASELMVRPDKSSNAIEVYDRLELSGRAMRRETGFDEDDAPDVAELNAMILKKLAVNPTLAILALEQLTGLEITTPEVVSEPVTEVVVEEIEPPPSDESPGSQSNGPPNTPVDGPEQVLTAASYVRSDTETAFSILQSKTRHVIHLSVSGWQLKHPLLCQPKLFSCPFSHVTHNGIPVHPGTFGSYECWLSATGEFTIGGRVFAKDEELIANPAVRSVGNASRVRA